MYDSWAEREGNMIQHGIVTAILLDGMCSTGGRLGQEIRIQVPLPDSPPGYLLWHLHLAHWSGAM